MCKTKEDGLRLHGLKAWKCRTRKCDMHNQMSTQEDIGVEYCVMRNERVAKGHDRNWVSYW